MKRTKPANHLWRCHGGETEPLCRVWGNPDKGQERCFFSEAWRAGGKMMGKDGDMTWSFSVESGQPGGKTPRRAGGWVSRC